MPLSSKDRISSAFRNTPTFFHLLSTLRTRRVGKGYRLEPGRDEVHPVTGRTLSGPSGPLAFVSCQNPEPLSELETALLCWAALGPNGIVAGDIGVSHDLGVLMSYAGRTIPAAANDHAVDLIFSNDSGTFLYRPSLKRTKPVEIETEEDLEKVLTWFREGCIRLTERRIDFDWAIEPGRPMGVWQYNLNRPGSTLFIPVANLGKGMVNLYFSVMAHMRWLITDEETEEPCGLEEWAKPGFLEVPITQRMYEETMLHMLDYQVGALIQNLRLACEALGLGLWPFGGFCEEIVMGGFRPLAKGLRFRYRMIKGKRNYIGIPKLLEGHGLPAPWFDGPGALLSRVLEERKQAMETAPYPYGLQRVQAIKDRLSLGYPKWVIEATHKLLEYRNGRYGRFPVYFSCFHANIMAQAHHIDEAFYKEYLHPGYLTPQHKTHEEVWHDNNQNP
jgi:hypothetical protein